VIRFEEAGYLAQVRRLSHLAEQVLPRWPIEVTSCRFLNHGENTTFRITSSRGKEFLLRIHRHDYHTRAGLLEELRWLDQLHNETPLTVPRPVPSRRGWLLEAMNTPEIGRPRHCSLLRWVDGRFLRKSVRPTHLTNLGRMIATLQTAARGIAVVERRYWDAEGLVGSQAKFGSIRNLPGASKKDQDVINKARHRIYHKLRDFQETFPHKLGLIHADLHFGNVLFSRQGVAAIDFDDCGFGFYAYDLAVPLIAVTRMLGDKRQRELPALKEALIEGYAMGAGWDSNDEVALRDLVTARKLAMLGWLRSRRDNPMLRKYLQKAIINAAKHLRTEHARSEWW
jgi:Ser/Thr protein kinase RdoA (MazF antagonist)